MLFHFSENPAINRFVPHTPPTNPDMPPYVWTIDEAHAPLYFFPRNCPRIGFWTTPATTLQDKERYLSGTEARIVIAIEGRWLKPLNETTLYRYSFGDADFRLQDANAGYYVAEKEVEPVAVERFGDLPRKLLDAGVELRVTPSLLKLQQTLPDTTLGFSMIRMRYAGLEP